LVTAISCRILDLRTGSGFESEDGNPLVGVRCEGSALFRCASYALLCLALGDPSDWSESAVNAWSGIPERVFFDEVTAFGSGPVHRAPAKGSPAMGSPSDPRITAVVRTLGPRELDPALSRVDQPEAGPAREARRSRGGDTDGLCPAGSGGTPLGLVGPPLASDPPIGQLEVTVNGARRIFPVGAQALVEGILLGRYDRCQGWELLADPEVSRVHALVIQLRDRLVAVDTASTHGTFVGSEQVRAVELRHGMTLRLAISGSVQVRWIVR
jgi:hypothetical protein